MKVLFRAALVVLTLFLSVAVAKDKGKDKDKSPGSVLHAELIGFQEVPVVSTVATGEFHGVINPGDQSIDYTLTYSGLQGATTQQAHIHIGQRSVNGGIVIWFCQSAAAPAPPGIPTVPQCTNGSGTFSGTITAANVVAIGGANVGQQVSAGEFGKVITAIRAGKAYANVHTNLSTGGEIRGQIKVLGKKGDDDDEDED
jgi:CHRD domain-containing protein